MPELESISTFLAGVDATANGLTNAVYNILSDVRIYSKLFQELKAATLESLEPFAFAANELQKFPDLVSQPPLATSSLLRDAKDACIREALWLSYGAPGKLPPVVSPRDMMLPGSTFPAAVSYRTAAIPTTWTRPIPPCR